MKNDNSLLRHNFEVAVGDYLRAFLKRMDWEYDNGYWISDDCTGVYAYGDNYFFNLADIIYVVDNHIDKDNLIEWHEYCVWAYNFNQTTPSLNSWVKGCPRASKSDMERISELHERLYTAVNELNNKLD